LNYGTGGKGIKRIDIPFTIFTRDTVAVVWGEKKFMYPHQNER